MYKFKLITFFGLLAIFFATAAISPHTGFGQDDNRNNATKLNCDEPPCDAVARGRAAFHHRNLNQIGVTPSGPVIATLSTGMTARQRSTEVSSEG